MTSPLPSYNEIALYIPYIHHDELDQVLQNIQLEEPDWAGGNSNKNNNSRTTNPSQVHLFTAVESPTDKGRNVV